MTSVRALLLVITTSLGGAPRLASQGGAAGDTILTMRRALEIAAAHAPLLKARASDVRGAQDALTLSKQRYFPTVELGAQAASATDNNVTGLFLPQSSLFPVAGPVRADESGTRVYGSAVGAMVAWAPYTFGQREWQQRQARAELTLARDNESVARFDEQVRLAETYLGLVRARELVRLQQQSLARADAFALSVQTLVASGLRPTADSLLAAADVSKARIDLYSAERVATVAGARLTEMLGLRGAAPPLSPDPYLDSIPSALGSAAQAALERHPQLQPFATRVALSDARQAVAVRAGLPRISVVGGIFARGSGIAPDGTIDTRVSGGLSLDRANSALGITVTVPVLDALFTPPRAGIEQARRDADRAVLADQQDRLRTTLTVADADLAFALQTSRETPVQLGAAAAAYRHLNTRYAAGLATLAELAQAQYLLTRAEVDDALARLSAWGAWLEVCAARGDLGPFLAAAR